MKPSEYRRGFQRALKESYRLLGRLLVEGMDIRAFERLSDDVEFQKACQDFKARIQGDNDAKQKFSLSNLNDFKENPEGFIKAVGDALEYIGKRKGQKNIRKAQRRKGVEIVYEDENCIITMPDGPKYARAAGSLIEGENSCPWCVANAYPDNGAHWSSYKVQTLLFIYKKENGEPVDAWCMVLSKDDVYGLFKGFFKDGEIFFEVLETLENKGDGFTDNNGVKHYERMLREIGMNSEQFRGTITPAVSSSKALKEILGKRMIGAATSGKMEMMVKLLEQGADVNYADSVGWTALMAASLEGCVEIMEVLLERGADVNAVSSGQGYTALGVAAAYGHAKACEVLIRHGADSKVRDKEGNSMLAQAVRNNGDDKAEETCRVLIKDGADVNARGVHGWTALRWSAFGKVESCKVLLENGADVNSKDEWGDTPLYEAAVGGYVDVCKVLLEHGADVNSKNNRGEPLFNSIVRAKRNGVDIWELILENGVDINATDKYGNTALHVAAAFNRNWLVRRLLEHGADAKARNNDGYTAMDFERNPSLGQFLRFF